MNAYHDASSDAKLSKFDLKLPISNELPDDFRRFVEIFMHLRTQMLVCLEIDLQHLSLDTQSQSFNASGSFSGPVGFDAGDSDQTPFIGGETVFFENDISDDLARKLRIIDQSYVDQTVYLNINGTCHGQKVFKKDLQYNLPGKRVIKSLQDRLIQA